MASRNQPMKFGILLPVDLGQTGEPDWVREFAVRAESLGFESVSAVEHAVVISQTQSEYPYSPTGKSHLPDDCSIPDPLELLSFIAAATSRLGLSTGVFVLPNHHPVVLAKRLATLDRLAAGRLRACLGLGWMKEEVEACGGDFQRRGKVADEAIAVMRALWAGQEPDGISFHGRFFSFDGAHSWPKPYRTSGVPLYIGGHSLAAARRAGRLGDGFQPLGLNGDELTAAIGEMRKEAGRAGRDPAELGLVLGAGLPRVDEAEVTWARELGADRILLSASRHARSLEEVLDEMAACSKRLGLA